MPPRTKLLYHGAEAKIFLVESSEGVGEQFREIIHTRAKLRVGQGKVGGKNPTKLIIKDRISKSYRIKELDNKIRKQRTKAEKKLLEKASKIINAPDPFPLKEFNKIEMPFIDGKKLSEHLDLFSLQKQKEICKKIGEQTAKLHDADIIHGDLTTSNMILIENNKNSPASQKDESNYSKKYLKYDKQSKNFLLLINQKISSEQSERDKLGGVAGDLDDGARTDFKIFFVDFGLGYISKKLEDKAVDLHLLKQALEAKHFQHWKTLFDSVSEGYKISKECKKVLEKLKAVEKRGRYKEKF